MKKLLTIVAVALILCLGLSVLTASAEKHDFRAQYNGKALRYENGVPVIDDINNKDWEKELLNKDNWQFVDNGQSPDLPGSDDLDSGSVVPKQNEQKEDEQPSEEQEKDLPDAPVEEQPSQLKVSLLNLFVASANADEVAQPAPAALRAYIVEDTRSNHGKMTVIMVLGENNYSAEAYVWLLSNTHDWDEQNIEQYDEDNGWCHLHPVCTECGEYKDWGDEYHDPNFVKKNADGVLECLKCGKTFAGDVPCEHEGVIYFEEMPNCKNGVLNVVSYYKCAKCQKTLEKEKVDGRWKVIEGADQEAIAPKSQQIVWETPEACINAYVAAHPTITISEKEDPEAAGTYDLAKMRREGDYDNKGHLWGKYVKFQDATCYADARQVRICWLCETTQDEPIAGTKLPPDFTAQAILCNSEDAVTLVCKRCEGKGDDGKHTIELNKGVKSDNFAEVYETYKDSITLIHDIDLNRAPDDELEPTCTTSGYQKWVCHNAGCFTNESFTVYLGELGHDFEGSEWINLSPADKDNHIRGWWSRKCTRCSTTEDYFGYVVPCDEHDFYTRHITFPTCTEEGLDRTQCYYCDYEKDEIVPTVDHMPVEGEEPYIIAYPGCLEGEEGWQGYICAMCGKMITEKIAPLGHPEQYWEPYEAAEPTCVTMGCSEGIWCGWCGRWVVEPEWYDFDPDNHLDPDENVKLLHWVDPTCEEEGYDFYVCEACGAAWIIDYDPLGHEYAWDEEEYEDYIVVIQEPTTEQEGIIWHYCIHDGCYDHEEEIVPVLPEEAEYKLTELDYYPEDLVAVGKVEPTTEGEAFDMWARVAFYLPSGDCMIQMVKVDEDGYFVAGASGNFNHISVIIVRVPVAYDPDVAQNNKVDNGGKWL